MAASMLKGSLNVARTILRKSSVPREVCRASTSKNTLLADQLRCLSYVINQRECKYQPTSYQSYRAFHTTLKLGDEVITVSTPPFADSITEGDVRWEKEVGDAVAEDDVIAEIETDKTSLPVHAPAAGIIEELLCGDGDTVQAGQALVKLKLTGAAPTPKPKEDAPAAAPPAAAPTPPAAPQSATTPAATAAVAGAIPTSAPPAPPVTGEPLRTQPTASVLVNQYQPLSSVPQAAASLPAAAGADVPVAGRTEQRVKMNRMRQRIGQRLKDAQNTCAMLTTFNEIDMSNVMEMRKQYKDVFAKKYGLKLGFMSAFLKASAHALTDQPVVNAVIDELEIVYRDYVDISVAVATPKGLVVPVLRNVDKMNYADIEIGLHELGEKARSGNLAIEDMDGGTFTISNGGVFGSMFGTPIINPPQSAILGMHGIFERPVAINGKVEIRPMMYVALTYDHRLIDGREAVTFLRKIKSAVEDPRTILMNL